jgi:hypothetical protein
VVGQWYATVLTTRGILGIYVVVEVRGWVHSYFDIGVAALNFTHRCPAPLPGALGYRLPISTVDTY